jgi:magnesium transporter
MTTTVLVHGRVTWTNIIHPTPEDMQELVSRYPRFHPLNLHDCLNELEFPKLETHPDYVFLVVQMPVCSEEDHLFRPAEVDIFIAGGILVTSHRGELPPLADIFTHAQSDESFREEWMGQGASPLLYRLINTLVDYCFPIVHDVSSNLKQIEQRMFQNDTRHLLQQVSVIRRDLITLRSILKLQQGVIEALIKGKWPFIHDDLDPYWGDISDHLSQLCLMLEEYTEVVSGLSETIDTLASHRIDEVVRLLTVVTVVTLPLVVLVQVFGMNIRMPFAEHPVLFYVVVGLGLCFTIGLIWYLRRHKWW